MFHMLKWPFTKLKIKKLKALFKNYWGNYFSSTTLPLYWTFKKCTLIW